MVESTVNTEEWALRLNKELTEARARIAALEAQLAEAKAASIEAKKLIYGGHINHAKDMIDDALSALEATPPAPKVTDAMVERMVASIEKQVRDTNGYYGGYDEDHILVDGRFNPATAIRALCATHQGDK